MEKEGIRPTISPSGELHLLFSQIPCVQLFAICKFCIQILVFVFLWKGYLNCIPILILKAIGHDLMDGVL